MMSFKEKYVFLMLLSIFLQISSQADLTLVPSSILVGISDFSLLLQSSNGGSTVSCSIVEVNSTVEADKVANNPPCKDSIVPISSSNWYLSNPTHTFDAGNSTVFYTLNAVKLVTLTDSGDIVDVTTPSSPDTSTTKAETTTASEFNATTTSPVANISSLLSRLLTYPSPSVFNLQELLVVSCCDDVSFTSTRVFVDVAPNMQPSNNYSGSVDFANPAYENIAPCPCDITFERCDISCCCDSDCPAEFVSEFECITGAFGGNYVDDDVRYCNTSQSHMSYAWHLFLCIESTNNPYLGEFFTNSSSSLSPLTSLLQIQNKLQSTNKEQFDYVDENLSSSFFINSLPAEYKQGDSMSIQQNDKIKVNFLTLPQNTGGGGCVESGTIEYLIERSSACNRKISEEICTSGTALDATYYIKPDTLLKFQSSADTVTAKVLYYCVDGADYVFQSSGKTKTFDQVGSSLFPITATSSSVEECIGSTNLQNIGGVCVNSVVNVTYEMKWEQNRIVNFTAYIYLANITTSSSIAGASQTVSQQFQVRFPFVSTNALLFSKSGNPGYDRGKPIIASESGDFLTDLNQQNLKLWQPFGIGLCADASTTSVLFGIDQTTSCALRLTLEDFSVCEKLRLSIVQNSQQSLFGSNLFVSRVGNPRSGNQDALKIILDDSLNATLFLNDTASSLTGRCKDIPATVLYQFVYTDDNYLNGFPVSEILAAKISFVRETWNMRCASDKTCITSSNRSESFIVTSQVSFIKIPASTTGQLSKNDFRINNTCERDATCWKEMFLPLSPAMYRTQSNEDSDRLLQYNFTFALIIILIAVGILLLQQDWKSIGVFLQRNLPI